MWDVAWLDPDRQLLDHQPARSIRSNVSSPAARSQVDSPVPSVTGSSLKHRDDREPSDGSASVQHDKSVLTTSSISTGSRLSLLKTKHRSSQPQSPCIKTKSNLPSSARISLRSKKAPSAGLPNSDALVSGAFGLGDVLRRFSQRTKESTDLYSDDSLNLSWNVEDSVFSTGAESDVFTSNSIKDGVIVDPELTNSVMRALSSASQATRERGRERTDHKPPPHIPRAARPSMNINTAALGKEESFLMTPPETPLSPPPLIIRKLGKLPKSPGVLAELLRTESSYKAMLTTITESEEGTDSSHLSCSATKSSKVSFSKGLQQQRDLDSGRIQKMSLKSIQKDIQRMATASQHMVLSRLRKEWVPEADERELEAEKAKWMLSVLYGTNMRHTSTEAPAADRNIIVMHESKDTSAYIAGLYAPDTVAVFSKAPLDARGFPNTRTLRVPSTDSEDDWLEPSRYDMIFSSTLASVCPSPWLPFHISHLASSLRPGGVFHCIIAEPFPNSLTCGQLLRDWLETNLMINMLNADCCMDPSSLFPVWLGEANLRGEGSKKRVTRFLACSGSVPDDMSDPDLDRDCELKEQKVSAELLVHVGRMLWKRTWGQYVTDEANWWWNDKDIMDECQKMGTFWHIHHLECVKDN